MKDSQRSQYSPPVTISATDSGSRCNTTLTATIGLGPSFDGIASLTLSPRLLADLPADPFGLIEDDRAILRAQQSRHGNWTTQRDHYVDYDLRPPTCLRRSVKCAGREIRSRVCNGNSVICKVSARGSQCIAFGRYK